MNERQWERTGAGAGILFVILLVLAVFLAPQPPHIDASADKIASYVTGHRRALLTAQVLGVLAAASFLWFLGHLRHVLERAEGGVEALSPIVTASGTALAAVGALASLPMSVLALMANSPEGLKDAALVRMLFDVNQVVGGGMLGILAALFLMSAGIAMVRKELVAPWLGWASLALAAVNGVTGVAAMTVDTYHTAWAALGFVSILGLAAVILVASAMMIWQPEAERGLVHPPVFVH